jgi:hypothetical protein
LLVLDILKTEKAAFVIVSFPIQNIPEEGHYSFRKKVGSALTETVFDFSSLHSSGRIQGKINLKAF